MVEIYFGRAGTGKTYKILSEIKEKFSRDINEKLILIVPEQYTLQAESDLIKDMGMEGIINFEVLSFNRLIEKVITDVGGLKEVEINSLGKAMILKKIFEEEKETLEVYGRAYKKIGFIREMSETISELKRADISVDKLLELSNSFEDNNLVVKKFKDISLIYSKYESNMENKFSDDEDKINYGCDKILNWELVKESEIWIDGFSGFTEQEYKIIERLFMTSKNVTVALTLDKIDEQFHDNIFRNTFRSFKRLKKISENKGLEVEVKEFLNSYRNSEIEHLENNFFSYPFAKFQGDSPNINIISAYDTTMEIENIVYDILDLVINENYKWKDISMVTSDIENYKGIINRVFSTYNIPYFIDSKVNVMNNPLIKFILLSLECLTNGFNQDKMIELLKTEYFGIENYIINRLENYILRRGIKGKRWFIDRENEDSEGFEEYYLSKFTEPLKKLYENFNENSVVEDYVKSLFFYIEELDIFRQHKMFIEKLKDKKLFEKVIENTQIWNKVIEVINQLVEISGQNGITAKEFFNLLEVGFLEISLGLLPSNDDVITIGSYSRSKLGKVKAIFLFGVNDGILPKGSEEYGLLMDEDKKILEAKGFEIKSSIDFRTVEEEYSIYQNISKPAERITFTYSLFNVDGKSMRPSMYIEKLKKIFPKITERKYYENEKNGISFSYGGSHEILKHFITGLRKLLDGQEINGEEYQFLSLVYKNGDERIRKIFDYLFYTNIPDKLSRQQVENLYKFPLVSSVSKMEKFANCPFAYFIKHGLRLKERQYYKVELPDIGIIFHDSLELFGKKIFSMNISWNDIDRDLSDKLVEEIVEEIIEEYYDKLFLSTNSNIYLINKIKRVVKRSVWVATKQLKSGKFEPKAFEIEFSDAIKDDIVPPIVIDINGKDKIYLEGRIDRLDLVDIDGNKYAKIIDYKSSDKKYSLSDAFNGLQMQLLIYMDAIIENSSYFTKNELYPGGIFYFKIDDPLIEISEKNYEKIENEISKKLKLEGLIVDNMDVIVAVDQDIYENGDSEILSLKLNKDGNFKKDSQVLKPEDFNKLMEHVKMKIAEMGSRIIDGDVTIFPAKNGDKKACDYCKYMGICQFDEKMEKNKYNRIKKYSDEEVVEKISSIVE